MHTRRPAVAGMFYPADAARLEAEVERHLDRASRRQRTTSPEDRDPKVLIVPHAGYDYSGPVAGTAFAWLSGLRHIERIVLIGPSHHHWFEGVATSAADCFETPLGPVTIDRSSVLEAEGSPGVHCLETAHEREHSLEVELPFLQLALPRFELVPLVFGEVQADVAGELLSSLWGGHETLIVVSSDLSHFLDYDSARRVDDETRRRIEAGRCDLEPQRACGYRSINAALWAAQRHDLGAPTTLDLRNSGDTAGGRDRVVGYGAWVLSPEGAAGAWSAK